MATVTWQDRITNPVDDMRGVVAYTSGMRRLWPLLVILGCSAPTSRATEPRATPEPPALTQQPATVPVPVPQSVTSTDAPPKSACEQDAASSECKCSQGVADSCFRLSNSEMRRGEHDVAIARVLGMCQQEIPQACFIGAKYLTRLHLEARLGASAADLSARGTKLYEQKCSANDQDTCVEYARLLLAGKYVAVDAKRGRELVEKACEAKQPRACLTLGNMYASGQGVKKDKKRAVGLLEQACTATGGAACTALAEQLPAAQRQRKAELYTRACTDDDADACARAGASIDVAGADAAHLAVAGPLLMKACELDELKSCVRAGELATNPEAARAAFEHGCDGEIFAACAGLAPLVATGKGGPRHFGDGVALADKACKQKVPKACDLAALLRRTPPEVSCATIDACQPLCDEGLPSGCKTLAMLEIAADPDAGCAHAIAPLGRACEGGDMNSCIPAGNASDGTQDSQRWYDIACRTNRPMSCALRDTAIARHVTGKQRQLAIQNLKKACRPSEPLICSYYAITIEADHAAEADTLLTRSCTDGVGFACRRLAERIDINPHYGVGDGSHQPFDEKLDKRVHELVERACKLGDRAACARQTSDRGEDPSLLPAAPCGGEPRWAP